MMDWLGAAESFERVHGCARGSAASSWRTSVRLSSVRHSNQPQSRAVRDIDRRLQEVTERNITAHRLSLRPSEGLGISLEGLPEVREIENVAVIPIRPESTSAPLSRSRRSPKEAPASSTHALATSVEPPFTIAPALPSPKVSAKKQSVRRLSRHVPSPGPSPSQDVRRRSHQRRSAQFQRRLSKIWNGTHQNLAEPPQHVTWRATVADPVYQSLLDQFGHMEMHRQEVIWELCQTEKQFVQTLCSIHTIFALPLKKGDGSWIQGVPASVARLFDWLEDIARLHSKLATAMHRLQADAINGSDSPIVVRFSEMIAKYIPRLERHLPYLLHFETSTAMIEDMMTAPQNEFGQFIRMQLMAPECGKLPFSSFLLKPVQRLMKYPLFFKVREIPHLDLAPMLKVRNRL